MGFALPGSKDMNTRKTLTFRGKYGLITINTEFIHPETNCILCH
jgi:hypothetical protein